MVAHLVRLKLLLLRNGLRRRPSQLIGLAVGLLYGGVALVGAVVVLVVLRAPEAADVRAPVLTLGGSVLLLAWLVVPVVLFGTDPTLDPRRFATYGIPSRQLATGLAVSALVSLPAVATAVLCLASIVPWTGSAAATVVAAVGAVVALGTAVLGSRVVTGWAAAALSSRRGRDVAVLVSIAAVIGYAALAPRLTDLGAVSVGSVGTVATVVGWTPLGWVWAAPGLVASGDVVGGLLRLALAVVLLLVLVQAWTAVVRSVVENPRGVTSGASRGRLSGLGLFGTALGSPRGAVAARSLTMWRRDPRYLMSAIAIPTVPLFLFAAASGAGQDDIFLFMPLMVAMLLGFGALNDVAYDGTAVWMHVAAGVSGRADRVGRLVPYVLYAVVAVPAYLALAGWKSGRWDALPALTGLTLALTMSGWGISSVTSVLLAYPAPGPGDNPFSSPPGSAGASALAQSVAMGSGMLLASPVALATAWTVFGDPPGWVGPAALAAGVAIGVTAMVVGVRVGAGYFERDGDKVLARLVRSR